MSVYQNVFFLQHSVIKNIMLTSWKSMCDALNDIARNMIQLYLFFIFIDIDKRLWKYSTFFVTTLYLKTAIYIASIYLSIYNHQSINKCSYLEIV